MTPKERLIEFADYKGFSVSGFEKETGLSNGALRQKGDINSDGLAKIIHKFTDLNLMWVVTGEGDMLSNTPNYFDLNLNSDDAKIPPIDLDKVPADQREYAKYTIANLQLINETISTLVERQSSQDKMIEELKMLQKEMLNRFAELQSKGIL